MIRRLLTLCCLALVVSLAFASAASAVNLKRLIAPASVCSGQGEQNAPAAQQEQTMRCLTNYARKKAGLGKLDGVQSLDTSAARKSSDIHRCNSFSHSACGRDFTYWMKRTGYLPSQCWRAGENIAWGNGDYGSPGSIFRAWMNSPGHRDNILSSSYGNLGVGLSVGTLEGYKAHVWTQHFGLHC